MLGFSRQKFIIFLVVILVLIIGIASGYARIIPDAVISVTAPVFTAAGKFTTSIGTWFSNVFQLAEQVEKTAELQREVRRLQAELAGTEYSVTENEQLRSLLQLQSRLDYEVVAATSVTEDPTRSFESITLNRGRDHGIEPGAAVLDISGNLLGVVSEVSSRSSQFIILTDRASRVDVSVLPKNALGVALGQHGVGIEVDFLPQESEISPSQTVVTAGLTRGIPAGLPVGSIDEVNSSQADLFKRASLVPFADMRNFRLVAVVKNASQQP